MGLNRLFRSRLQRQKRRNHCEDQRDKKPSKRASLMPLRWKKQRLRISLMKGRKKRRRRQTLSQPFRSKLQFKKKKNQRGDQKDQTVSKKASWTPSQRLKMSLMRKTKNQSLKTRRL